MSLSAGSRLGPYEIAGLIGRGGMGEVYKARDTKLGRDVALKVLPDLFADDPDRLARFQREAQVLASLNHPHIAIIHGLEEADGVRALVLELVEGPTLAEIIARGATESARLPQARGPQRGSRVGVEASAPSVSEAWQAVGVGPHGIPLNEALPIARQIAEALEAAHEQGVMHRDLKPSNIKLRPDGVVKVLDFGLAKALDPLTRPSGSLSPGGGEGWGEGASQSPTLSVAATRAGVILGTAAYMSPEQARGKAVDKRTDIWAFGCVLFEMLSGTRAFAGDEVSDVLASVLAREPDLALLPTDTPPSIRRLLRRCLQKDRKERLHDISDARIEIQDAQAKADPDVTTSPVSAVTRRSRERLAWSVAASVSLALLGLLPFAIAHLREVPAESTAVRFSVSPPQDAAFTGGFTAPAQALSPDGRLMVFRAQRSGGPDLLWVRPIDSLDARPLAGTEGGDLPFWSPDSRFVGFFAQGKLRKIDISGGPAQTLCDAPNGEGGTWNRDGIIVFAPTGGLGLSRVSAAGGAPTPLTTLNAARKETSHRWPQFLPDGRRFLFLTEPGDAVHVGSLDAPETKSLLNADSKALYAPPGYLMFVREQTLMAQPFDALRAELAGDAFPIAEQVSLSLTGNIGRAAFSVSDSGVLAYRTGSVAPNSQLVWFDRAGKQVGYVGSPGPYSNPELSPDDRRVAVDVVGEQRRDIWVFDAQVGTGSQFTFEAAPDTAAIWSPDGKKIVFASRRDDGWNLYQKNSDGSGQGELITKIGLSVWPSSWSSDGRYVIYRTVDARGNRDLWFLPLFGDRKPVSYLQTPFEETRANLSPDGRWLAYISDESGQPEIYVQSFPQPGSKWRVSNTEVVSGSSPGAVLPRWRRDGKELYYISNGRLVAVEVQTAPVFSHGVPRALFEVRTNTSPRSSYSVTGDGQRFLVNTLSEEAASAPITVVVNWPALLKK